MRLFKPLVLALLMVLPDFAQIPAPQINLSGNIGCQGFPCVNNGTLTMASDANRTMTAQETSAFYIKVTSSVSLTATRNLVAPAGRFPFTIENATTGGQSVQIIGASGTGVTIANGTTVSVWNDGTNFVQIGSSAGGGITGSGTANSLTKWTGTSAVGNAGMTDSGSAITANEGFQFNASAQMLPQGNATSSANFSSQPLSWGASYWTGSVAAGNQAQAELVPGTGTNPALTLQITDSSAPNGFAVQVPALNVVGPGPSQEAFIYNATPIVPGSSTTAVIGSDASGHLVESEAGGSIARVCDASNGVCASSNPSDCSIVNATNICVTQAPYYASVAGMDTTATAGTNAPGTTITLASGGCVAGGFDATTAGTQYGHQGVSIAGAGTSGGLDINTVTTCVGATMVVTSATLTSVATGAVVQHDETHAIQSAITALATSGGTIYFPSGFYEVNGPLQDTGSTSHCNCVLQLPTLLYPASSPVQVSFVGAQQPIFSFAGSTILTQIPSGNLLGGTDISSTMFGPFTNVYFSADYMTFRDYANPGLGVLALGWVVGMRLNHVWIDTGGSGTAPTNSASFGIQAPFLSNSAYVQLNDVTTVGQYMGYLLNEHTQANSIYASNEYNCFVFESSPSGLGGESNSASVDYSWGQQCSNQYVSAGANPIEINIQNADIEDALVQGIEDPGNLLKGYLTFNVPYIGGAVTPTNPAQNGGANLNVESMNASNVTKGGASFSGQICPDASAGAYSVFTLNADCSEPTSSDLGIVGFEGSVSDTQLYEDARYGGGFTFRIGNITGTPGYQSAGVNITATAMTLLAGTLAAPALGITGASGLGPTTITSNASIGSVTPLTISSTATTGGFVQETLPPNLATGQHIYELWGTGCTPSNNSAYIGFVNAGGTGSASNFGTLGQCYKDNILNWFGTGDVAIGSTTDPGVALGVTGTINATTNITVAGNSVCQSTGTNCPSGSMVYPSAGIANSTGSAWGTSYGVSGTGSVALTASPTFTGTLNAAAISASGTVQGAVVASTNGVTAGTSVQANTAIIGNALGTANSGANFNSAAYQANDSYWTGSAAAAGGWTWKDVLGSGANPTTTLTFAYSGTPGVASVSMPAVTATTLAATGLGSSALPVCTTTGGQLTNSGCTISIPASPYYWDVQGVLFSTATMLGPVFKAVYNTTAQILIARLSGTISCAVAPTINLMDLGTSPSTVYSSATSVGSLSTGTSDGLYSNLSLGASIIGTHYYGIAFSAGTCVTAPAFDISATF